MVNKRRIYTEKTNVLIKPTGTGFNDAGAKLYKL
ncbi:hypothetical protein UNH65_00650 [Chitinophaga sp. 180180018-2]|nr:hypothetical protein [Chitinophaga sp. 212800010-3]